MARVPRLHPGVKRSPCEGCCGQRRHLWTAVRAAVDVVSVREGPWHSVRFSPDRPFKPVQQSPPRRGMQRPCPGADLRLRRGPAGSRKPALGPGTGVRSPTGDWQGPGERGRLTAADCSLAARRLRGPPASVDGVGFLMDMAETICGPGADMRLGDSIPGLTIRSRAYRSEDVPHGALRAANATSSTSRRLPAGAGDSLGGAFSLGLTAEPQRLPQVRVQALVVLRIGFSPGSAEDRAEEASGANGEDHAEDIRVIKTVTAQARDVGLGDRVRIGRDLSGEFVDCGLLAERLVLPLSDAMAATVGA